MEADGTIIIKWWIYTSYGVQKDYRRHTVGTISLGKGHPYSTSSKHKLNTQSSKESDLVRIDNLMSMVLWTRLFVDAQVHDAKDNILYHDKNSTIRLANNGKSSSRNRTKYINGIYKFM